MCGIFATTRCMEPNHPDLLSARVRTAPRGPDGFSQAHAGPWLVEHHALKTTGDSFQPFEILAGDRRIVWAVNGQFYRHGAHRKELQTKGAVFKTDCDSEILGWAWLLEGEAGLSRLEGEFAWILWDSNGQALRAGRDVDGCRPMHWARGADGSVSLASDWVACSRLAGLRGASAEYFQQSFPMQYAPPDMGPVAGLHRIPPGTIAIFQEGEPPQFSKHPDGRRAAPPFSGLRAEDVYAALSESVKSRMPTIPFAAHLSAGLDSASICALLTLHGRAPAAYCVDFGPGGELQGAAESAALLGLDLRAFEYSAAKGLFDLRWSTLRSGHACMDAHVGAKARLSDQIAADGFRVVFSGEGADEAFLGYEHCVAEAGLASKESSMAGVHTTSETVDCPHWSAAHGRTPRWIQAKLAMCRPMASLLVDPPKLSDSRNASIRGVSPAFIDFARTATEAWRDRVMSGYILPAVDDGASSASGLESRMPFLDASLLAMARSIPSERHLDGGRSKALLRNSLAVMLPEAIRSRPKKPFMGSSISTACSNDAATRAQLLGNLEEAPWDSFVDKKKSIELVCALLGAKQSAANDASLWLLASSAALAKHADDLPGALV